MHCEMYGPNAKKVHYTETHVKTYLVLMAVAILLVFLAAQTIMERIERRGAPAARGAATVVVHTRRGWG